MNNSVKTQSKIQTIDIQAKEWFDKVNGNSYFSAIVTINFGLEDEQIFKIHFEYGYGDYYIQASGELLNKLGIINKNDNTALWRYCDENNIILRTNKKDKCLKRDVVNYTA